MQKLEYVFKSCFVVKGLQNYKISYTTIVIPVYCTLIILRCELRLQGLVEVD